MSALAEFLHKQAGTLKVKTEANRQTIAEWRGAVEALFNELRGWLTQADPEGVLLVEQGETEIDEPGLGRYRMPCLAVRAAERSVAIIPNCRFTVVSALPSLKEHPRRATGRVDMVGKLSKQVLFRLPGGEGHRWFIDDSEAQKPLDRLAFEEALVGFLR